jgi:superfamily II DNA or RNA helicase
MSIILPELYPEKKKVLNIIENHLNQKEIGYLDVPTGWGKTFLSKHLIKKYVEEGKRILFVTSRNKYLLLQTYFSDIDKEIPLFPNSICLSSDFPMSKWDDDKIKDYILNNEVLVVFASLQTILSKKKEGLKYFFSVYFDLVILDEIHNFIKNMGNDFINQIIEHNKDCHIFGMTATPFQGVVNNLKYVEDITQDMNEIFHKTIAQCILDEQLSPLTYNVVHNYMDIDVLFDLGKNLQGLKAKELYLDWRQLEKITERTRLAKQVYDERIDPKTKTLVFCAPVKNIGESGRGTNKKLTAFHAKLCSGIFNNEVKKKFDPNVAIDNKTEEGKFKHAAFISSELKQKEIKEVVTAFKTPDAPPYVLCTVGMLVEGFNFPRLKNIMLLRPTLSMRLFEQEIGRVLRKHKEKKAAHVYEIVDNVDMDTLFDRFGETIFSPKKLKRLLMLNPEHRLEKLFIQTPEDMEAFEKNLIKIQQDEEEAPQEIIDVEEIKFKNYDDAIHDLVRKWPPLDFRVKLFLKTVQKMNTKKSGNFKKDKNVLLDLITRFQITTKDDLKDLVESFPVIEKMHDHVYDDRDLSQNVLEDKSEFFKEVGAFIKLKALAELENLPNLADSDKEEALEWLGFKDTRVNIEELKEKCILEGKGMSLDRFLNQLNISIGVLTGELEKRLQKEIKSGQISKRSRIFNQKAAKGDVIWAETFYHNDLDFLQKRYKKFYSQKDIKIQF